MSDTINCERCPETGICSIFRGDTEKVDLMPDEVDAIRDAAGDPEVIRAAIAESDEDFAGKLTIVELAHIGEILR